MDEWDKIKDISVRFKGLTQISIANIAGSAILGIFWLFMARLMGTAHYGEVSYYIAIAGIGTIFSYLGSGTMLTIYTAKGVKIQATIYFISITCSVVAATIVFFIFHNIAISLFLIGNVIFGLATSEMLGSKLYKKYAINFILEKVLVVALSIPLYYLIGPNGVVYGIALSFFPSGYRIYQGFRETRIDFSLIKSRLGFLVNSYVLDITRTFSTTTDKLLVAPLFGFALLGNYQLGVQVLSILVTFPSIVFQYIVPHEASGNVNRKLKIASILFSVLLAILGVTLTPFILPILFPKFPEAIQLVQITSLTVIPIAISQTYISKFLAAEKSKIVLTGSAIFLAFQVTLIILLGKIFGINGVASSLVLAQSAETIYLFVINYKYKEKQDISK